MSSPSSISHLQSSSNAAQSATLLDSFRIQLRVIRALLMREVLTRFGRHNIGFMWMFVEPMIFTLGVTILWNIMGGGKGGGISITAFVFTGYSALLLWRNVPGRCVMALQPNFSLMFHRSVKPIDVYISRILLEVTGATISFVILGLVLYSTDLVPLPYDYIKVWSAWLLLAWFAGALGMLVGALSEQSDIVEKLWHPATYLLIPLSGSFSMASTLPPAFRDILLLNPTVHCNELLRDGFFGPGHEWFYSVSYVVIFNMILTLLALAQVRYVSKTLVMSE